VKERFEGDEGKRRLVEELLNQKCIRRTPEMANDLAGVVTLHELKAGAVLIQQDAEDTDMYFILAGKMNIVVNERVLAQRVAGEHVGEMALIDPKAKRSAAVVAKDTVVVAGITEPEFTRLAATHPTLWRYLALELADRLRQRNQWVKQPNAKPHIFIGSSAESLLVAHEIHAGLAHDKFLVKVWTDGVFQASRATIQDLMVQVDMADFAVMVFTPDDNTVSRHKQADAPRDNVVFELGLFMGDVGPERTFIVKPRGAALKIPTDLLGLTPLEYDASNAKEITAAIAPVCHAIRKRVTEQGPK
jgi:predicted nucleotide-binding protein